MLVQNNMNFKMIKSFILPLFVLLTFNSFFIVNEFEQAIVLQFGKPIGESKTNSGIYFKVPFVQNIIKFEKITFEKKDNPFFPKKINIYFDGKVFKLE